MVGQDLERWMASFMTLWEWRVGRGQSGLRLLQCWGRDATAKVGRTLLWLFVWVVWVRGGPLHLEGGATVRGVLLLDI